MQEKVYAAIESVTVLGLSAAASLLLIAGLAGAVMPQAGNGDRTGVVTLQELASSAAERQIVHLLAIQVVGTRAAGAANERD